MSKIFRSALSLVLLLPTSLLAQNTRTSDHNSIGWFALNTTVKIDEKWSIANELQWRRVKFVNDPLQNLLKIAANYTIVPGVNVRAGYALAETYAFGDYPLNAMGKQFTEHRSYQMLSMNNANGIFDHTHRFMLEQRWIGRYSDAALTKEDEFVYANRLRYMYRLQIPLKGLTISDNTPYLAAYDEVFVAFGKNVNENVFDQNRVGILLGYRFSPTVRIEGGYLNQIAQLGREIGGRNVFQYNSGFILNTNLNF